jgi:phenylacetic acid degradation protein paaN
MNSTLHLFDKHKYKITEATDALFKRYFYAAYPENPKAYGEEADANGKTAFAKSMNHNFGELLQGESKSFIGEEISPYLQVGIGIKYPSFDVETLVANSQRALKQWRNISAEDRAGILVETLERIKERFFEIAYATMHTTGQSFMMSFQASGPHACDRSMEAIAQGMSELNRFPQSTEWKKNLGKFDLVLNKNWKAVPKGISLVIGCSTFPTWNSVPGMYASLITGNTVIVKPHPKAVLPMAIVIAEVQKVLQENGIDPCVCQLAVDSSKSPVTKQLAEHTAIKLIDYTGSTSFGKYVESIPGKQSFTENAGVNSVILHSTNDLKATMQNIAFSVSLYSGQMCTAPQNIFIPSGGIETPNGIVSYADCTQALVDAINGIVNNPKAGPPTVGAIQSDITLARTQNAATIGGKILLNSAPVKNEEFEHARTASPTLIEVSGGDMAIYQTEQFGPIAFLIKCKDIEECISKAKQMAIEHGAITCLAFSTNAQVKEQITSAMNEAFTPVSFNFSGAAFVNQHAAFSDFHVTGGNPSGNASFTNPEYINRRFVWVGNREMA